MNSSSFNARKRSRPWNPFSRHHSGELPQVKANPKKNNELNESKGDSSLLSLIASMTKSLMDSCALSLSSGIAIYGNSPKAIFAGIFWIFWLSLVFGFFCWLIAHLCQLTGSTTIRGIWQSTVGPKGAYLVSLANTFKAALSSWAYATILSDLLQTLLLETWGYSVPRWFCLTGVTTFGIVPLCMLDHLNSLAPFFIVGSAGIIFTAVSMGIRYCDGSYREGGMYYNELPADYKPQFGTENHPWSFAILPFCCMTYEAFVMHYNSARFYTCLQDRNLSRFAFAVGCSFGLSALTYMGIAVFGFLTFGSGSSEDILSNYNPKDKLIMISRLGVGISTLASYPIVFFAVRDGCIELLGTKPEFQTPTQRKAFKSIILGALTVISIFITDLNLINVLGGGLVGTLVVFVFPTMALKASGEKKLLRLSMGLSIFGVVLGLLGVYTQVKNEFSSTTSTSSIVAG